MNSVEYAKFLRAATNLRDAMQEFVGLAEQYPDGIEEQLTPPQLKRLQELEAHIEKLERTL